MKSRLMAYAAIAAFTLPLVASPVAAVAQERGARDRGDLAQGPQRDRGRPGGGSAQAPQSRPQESRGDRPSGGQRPDGGGRPDGGDRPDRPSGGWSNGGQRPDAGARPDRPGGQRPDGDRPNRPDWNNGGQRPDNGRPDRPDWNGGGQRPDRPGGQRPDNGRPDRPDWNGGGQRPDNGRPDRPDWNNGGNRPDRPGAGRPDAGRPDNGRPGAQRPDNGRPGGNWNNNGGRPGNNWDRDRQRQDYRNRFDSNRWQREWNRNQRSDWWRNDRRFRGWSGVRIGFYFAPGYGYYSVPRNYYGQRWYAGQYLPSIFWRYQLNDWRTYGLGYPPVGTRWVYVDNSIYLIDEYDGYIMDVIRDFWRW